MIVFIILDWKLFPYGIINTARERNPVRGPYILPHHSDKLPVGNRSQKSVGDKKTIILISKLTVLFTQYFSKLSIFEHDSGSVKQSISKRNQKMGSI